MTKPRGEELADLSLRLLGLKTFFPHWIEFPEKRVKIECKRAFFPSYIFVEDPSRFDVVSGANGVSKICCYKDWDGNSIPCPVPDKVMDPIIGLAGEDGLMKVSRPGPRVPQLRPRDRVVVDKEEAPLFGFVGEIKRLIGKGLAEVMLANVLLGKRGVKMRLADLKKIA